MQKKIRIKDIAELAGVSAGTVDRILHNRGNVSEPARKAVEKVLRKVNYKPNIHVSGLSLKRKYKVIITTPEVSPGEYWESIHNGIARALQEYENIEVKSEVYTYNQYDLYSCRETYRKIALVHADAVIIGPTFKNEALELCRHLDEVKTPYVFVDSTVEGTGALAFFSSDHYVCGFLMAKLITSVTPRNSDIGILQAVRVGDESAHSTTLRKMGFNDFLLKNQCSNTVFKIPFSVKEPEKNESLLTDFFDKNKNIRGIVALNSRGNVIANYLHKNNMRDNVQLICMDVTEKNVLALKNESIDFLIGQGPEYQGFHAMKTLIAYLIFRNPVDVRNYVQLDILTKETVDFYQKFGSIL